MTLLEDHLKGDISNFEYTTKSFKSNAIMLVVETETKIKYCKQFIADLKLLKENYETNKNYTKYD